MILISWEFLVDFIKQKPKAALSTSERFKARNGSQTERIQLALSAIFLNFEINRK
jgi:hypothetical protein